MAFHVKKDTLVNAPRQFVWNWMMNDETQWRKPFVTNVEKISAGSGPEGEIGAEYRNRLMVFLIPTHPVNRVTAYEPPHLVSWDTISGDELIGLKDSSYVLEEIGAQTRVTLDFTYTGLFTRLPFRPLTRRSTELTVALMLRNIKKGAEQAYSAP